MIPDLSTNWTSTDHIMPSTGAVDYVFSPFYDEFQSRTFRNVPVDRMVKYCDTIIGFNIQGRSRNVVNTLLETRRLSP